MKLVGKDDFALDVCHMQICILRQPPVNNNCTRCLCKCSLGEQALAVIADPQSPDGVRLEVGSREGVSLHCIYQIC